jgi:hypothetical protein
VTVASPLSDRELRLECARLAAAFCTGDGVDNAERLYRFISVQQSTETLLSLGQVLDLLRIHGGGKQCALAREAALSEAYVSKVMRGEVEPSARLLTLVGCRKVIAYERDAA